MYYVKLLLAFVLIFSPTMVFAEISVSPHTLISEFQTGSVSSPSHEFVELYNPTEAAISVEGWVVEYKSATSVDTLSAWTKKATLSGTLPSHGFYLIAPKSYLSAANAEWSVGMASPGGNIRLRSSEGTTLDQVGYGVAANAAETNPASAPAAGQSLERLPGAGNETGGNAVDTNNNVADFIIREVPAPQNTASSAEIPGAVNEVPVDAPGELPVEPTVYPKITITELLIDPQAPLTDAEDEFIEIYNPATEAAVISGYTLRAGTGFKDLYVLPETIIGGGEYLALFSRDTKLSLVNTGGAVQILDPTGVIIDQTDAYPDAEPGLTWALVDGSWDWTLQSTPASANVYVAPLVAAPTATKKLAASKKAAVTKVPKKATSKKVAAAKKPKTTKVKAAATSKPAPPMAKNFQPANWLIALLIGLTISYAIYEFRYDIQNIYRRARGHS